MERASPSRLKAFAVFAFWAEITRLPSHWSVKALPVKATAQTVPSTSTMLPHMLRSSPPLLGPPDGLTASCKALARASWPGRLPQSARAADEKPTVAAAIAASARILVLFMTMVSFVVMVVAFRLSICPGRRFGFAAA